MRVAAVTTATTAAAAQAAAVAESDGAWESPGFGGDTKWGEVGWR